MCLPSRCASRAAVYGFAPLITVYEIVREACLRNSSCGMGSRRLTGNPGPARPPTAWVSSRAPVLEQTPLITRATGSPAYDFSISTASAAAAFGKRMLFSMKTW